jgi:nitrate/nitrite transporter NarK
VRPGRIEPAVRHAAMAPSLGAGWAARKTSNEVATAIALALGAIGTALSPALAYVPAVYVRRC